MLNWAATWQNQQSECAPSLIRVFAVRMKKAWVLSYPWSAQRRLWSDWADAQADLSLCRVHSHFVGFVTRWLNSTLKIEYVLLGMVTKRRNFTLVFKIVLLGTFKIDWIPIIKFDTSNILLTNLIHQICVVSSEQLIIIIVFMFSSNLFEVMLSHNHVWLLSCINRRLTWMGHWKRKTPNSAR